MSKIARYEVSLTLRSPFMFQGLANSRFGVDAAYLRGEEDQPIIPADQIKGVLRSACFLLTREAMDIAPMTLFSALFGSASAENPKGDPEKYDFPNRGALIAADLSAEIKRNGKTFETTRIEIDDETGAAKSGALQVVELAAPFGEEVEFIGCLHLLAKDGVDPNAVATLLSRAIKLVPAIGAFKSAGFGEVVRAGVTLEGEPEVVKQAAASPSDSVSERLAYRVTFDRPILVEAMRETDNLFVGSTIVPGAAFKGALATKLKLAGINPEDQAGDWGRALAALRISHAFPENDDGVLSGFPVPHSLCAWKDSGEIHFADSLMSFGDGTCGFVTEVVKSGTRKVVAPTHPADWKDEFFDALGEEGLLPKAPKSIAPQPRTHVRIDGETLAGVDTALFTTVAQGVLRRDREKRAWRVVVDFANVAEDRRAALRILIEGTLYGVGRTGACVKFERIESPPGDADTWGRIRLDTPPAPRPIEGHANLFALTLITPALLTDPPLENFNKDPFARIDDQYRSHIAAQTGGTLVRSYTSRRLAGGYIATRRRPYGKTYYPFVLTEPGSVFLVEGGDKNKFAKIAQFGFEPITLTGATRPLDWVNCRYLRENGYGEVVFSLVKHGELAGNADG